MISKGNHVKFARFVLLAVSEKAITVFNPSIKTLKLNASLTAQDNQCIQLLYALALVIWLVGLIVECRSFL